MVGFGRGKTCLENAPVSQKIEKMEMNDFDFGMVEMDEIDRLIAELNQYTATGPEESMTFRSGNECDNDNLRIPSMYEEILQMERDENYDNLMPETQEARKPEATDFVAANYDQNLGDENPWDTKLTNTWFVIGETDPEMFHVPILEPKNEQLPVTVGPTDFQGLFPIPVPQPEVAVVALNNLDQQEQNEVMSESRSPSSVSTGRSKKRAVPVEHKNEKYWEKRNKNTEATKRSRELKKTKIGKIVTTKESKEEELADLRVSHKNLKKKCFELENSNQSLEETLSKVSELCKIDDAFSELRAMEE